MFVEVQRHGRGEAGERRRGLVPLPLRRPEPDSAKSAYARLLEGNGRWVKGALQHPDQDPARRAAVAPSSILTA
ncbi:hypothetical protein [Streptomyces coeruleorubidus]|uniref:hypothetical protein n=1 Tax=Streptomyces coeruleorubidus TaxID=116188 RepID=UPI0033C43FF6